MVQEGKNYMGSWYAFVVYSLLTRQKFNITSLFYQKIVSIDNSKDNSKVKIKITINSYQKETKQKYYSLNLYFRIRATILNTLIIT